jgi:hypothetical protein
MEMMKKNGPEWIHFKESDSQEQKDVPFSILSCVTSSQAALQDNEIAQ